MIHFQKHLLILLQDRAHILQILLIKLPLFLLDVVRDVVQLVLPGT